MSAPYAPSRCPSCGEDNQCGRERGAATCWCFNVKISPDVLKALPEKARGVACLCPKCAAAVPPKPLSAK